MGIVNIHLFLDDEWRAYEDATVSTTTDMNFVVTTPDSKQIVYPFDAVKSVVVTGGSGSGAETVKVNYATGPSSHRLFENVDLFWWDDWVFIEQGTGRDILAGYRKDHVKSIEINP